eukprot:4904357-Alexandrium_andersonii.AAC.1
MEMGESPGALKQETALEHLGLKQSARQQASVPARPGSSLRGSSGGAVPVVEGALCETAPEGSYEKVPEAVEGVAE